MSPSPVALWWLAIPALVLLWLACERQQVGWWSLCAWGLVIYGVHAVFLLRSFATLFRTGPSLVGGWAFLTFYFVLHAGLWGWCMGFVRQKLVLPWCRLLVYCVLSWGFFSWIATSIFWVFDCWEGYPLLDILAPFGAARLGCVWTGLLGFAGARLLVLVYAMICTLVLVYVRWWLILALFVVTIGLFVPLAYVRTEVPAWVPSVGVAHAGFLPLGPQHSAVRTGQVYGACLCGAVSGLLAQWPNVRLLIAPEAAFPPCLNKDKPVCRCLSQALEGRQLVLGAARSSYEGIYTSVYLMESQGIVDWYDKTHGMFFIERTPKWFAGLQKWVGYGHSTMRGLKPVKYLRIGEDQYVLPCVCSELFFTDCIASCPRHVPVVACVNDGWYQGNPITHLLWGVARLKASAHQVSIVYVSFAYAQVLLPDGCVIPLPQCCVPASDL